MAYMMKQKDNAKDQNVYNRSYHLVLPSALEFRSGGFWHNHCHLLINKLV